MRWLSPLLLCAGTAFADAGASRFDEVVVLPDGRVATIAEPSREPRSIGSYAVRLYGARNPNFPFDDFIAGVIMPRDGSVREWMLDDINADGREDLVVIIVSAGSGSYQSADAFHLARNHINRIAHVEGLAPQDDAATALQAVAGKN